MTAQRPPSKRTRPRTCDASAKTLPLIVNLRARSNRRRRHRLLTELSALSDVQVYVSESLTDLERIVDSLAAQVPSKIAICGGDGSLSRTITALKIRFGQRIPPILLLRGGSMNMVADSLGLPATPVAALRAVVHHACFEIQTRDTLEVNGHYGFIFGLGLVTHFLEEYYTGKDTGPARAASVASRLVTSALYRGALARQVFRPIPGTLLIDGQPDRRDWTVLLAQTIQNLGLGAKPCYRAMSAPGRCHVLAADASASTLITQLPRIIHGRPWPSHTHMRDELASGFSFHAEQAFSYVLDGEIYQADSHIGIKVATPTRFVVPKEP